MLKPIRRTKPQNQEVKNLDEAVSAFANQFSGRPQLDSVLIKEVSLKSGQDNLVAHKLGRKFEGWQCADIDTNATVWRSGLKLPELFINLRVSSDCIVSLIVF